MLSKGSVNKVFVLVLIGIFLISLMGGVFAQAINPAADEAASGRDTIVGGGTDPAAGTGETTTKPKKTPISHTFAKFFFESNRETTFPEDSKLTFLGSVTDWQLFEIFMNPGDTGAVAEFVKLMILLLVIILVYSALTQVQFPDQATLRVLIAVIVGFISTVMITQSEILAIMTSYTALGVTMALFFPILILAFFSFVVAVKVNVMGILVQKIMWIIYSVYLGIQALALLIIKWAGAEGIAGIDVTVSESSTILIILLVAAIVIPIFFVRENDHMITWIADTKRSTDLDIALKDKHKRAEANVKQHAEATKT